MIFNNHRIDDRDVEPLDTAGRLWKDIADCGGYAFLPVDSGDPAQCNTEDEDRLALGGMNRIRGRVYFDRSEDGVVQPGDRGLAGIRIILDENRATDTDTTGTFWFDDLLPGIYQVSLDLTTLPEGVIPTTDTVKTVVLEGGRTFLLEFGLIRYKRVRGIVFDDLNGNGQRDAKEPGVPAVRVRIQATDHAAWTTGDGTFRIDRVPQIIHPTVLIDDQQPYLDAKDATLAVEME